MIKTRRLRSPVFWKKKKTFFSSPEFPRNISPYIECNTISLRSINTAVTVDRKLQKFLDVIYKQKSVVNFLERYTQIHEVDIEDLYILEWVYWRSWDSPPKLKCMATQNITSGRPIGQSIYAYLTSGNCFIYFFSVTAGVFGKVV